MSPGAGATPSEAATSTSAPVRAASASVDEAHALEQVGAQRRRRGRPALGVHDGLPAQPEIEPAQRAQEQPQGTALLLLDEGDAHGCVVTALGPRERVGARRYDRVLAREEAPQQVGGGAIGRGSRVEAPEDELDDLARDLGGDDALGRRVEGADVERARVAQRRAGHAGRERLVHVAQVERGALEEVGDRARDVDRQRRTPAARERRQRLAHGQHAHLARGRARARRRAPPCASRARSAREDDGRHHDHRDARAAASSSETARDERVDVVAVLPRIGGDLGYGQRLGHRGQDRPVARAGGPATAGARRRTRAPPARRARRRARCRPAPRAPSRRRAGRRSGR